MVGKLSNQPFGGLPSTEHDGFDRLKCRCEGHSLIYIEGRSAGGERPVVQSARQPMEQRTFPAEAGKHIPDCQRGKVSEAADAQAAQQSDQFGILQDTDR
jgi:hypothetical protein